MPLKKYDQLAPNNIYLAAFGEVLDNNFNFTKYPGISLPSEVHILKQISYLYLSTKITWKNIFKKQLVLDRVLPRLNILLFPHLVEEEEEETEPKMFKPKTKKQRNRTKQEKYEENVKKSQSEDKKKSQDVFKLKSMKKDFKLQEKVTEMRGKIKESKLERKC